MAHLIPNVLWVVFHMVLLQKRDVFLLERSLLMVLLLFRNVLGNVQHAGLTHAEHAISCLPCKVPRVLLAHPSRRIGFYYSCNLGGGMHRPHANQHMNMIRFAVHDQGRTMHLANDASEIRE